MRTRRLARHRVRRLERSSTIQTNAGTGEPCRDPLVWLGRSAAWGMGCTGFGADSTVDVATHRVRGGAIVVAGVIAVMSPILGLIVGVVAWHLPRMVTARRRRRERGALVGETLLAVELCAVAIHTGATVPQCIDAVAPYLRGRLGTALRAAMDAYRGGALLDDRLCAVADELGDGVVEVLAVLRAAHVDGDPVEPALTRLADRMRDEQRRQTDAEVRKLSVRLLVPLVCCSLPGFVLIAVVPVALGALGGLGH